MAFVEEPVPPLADGLGVDLKPLGGGLDRPSLLEEAATMRRRPVGVSATFGYWCYLLRPEKWLFGNERGVAA